MSNLSLQKQAIEVTSKLAKQIAGLKEDDPLQTWFTIELSQIGLDDIDDRLSLDETNARISALKQLQFLVFRQERRLMSPGLESLDVDNNASLFDSDIRDAVPCSRVCQGVSVQYLAIAFA